MTYYELHNLIEDEVIRITNELLKDREDICTCDKCKLDIAAIALNNLKPKYVVNRKRWFVWKSRIH